MSVGGRVAYTRDLGYMVEIVTWESNYPSDDYTAIRVEKNSLITEHMSPGDSVWWQGRKAFWTPRGRRLPDGGGVWHEAVDVELQKIANSYSVPSGTSKKSKS